MGQGRPAGRISGDEIDQTNEIRNANLTPIWSFSIRKSSSEEIASSNPLKNLRDRRVFGAAMNQSPWIKEVKGPY